MNPATEIEEAIIRRMLSDSALKPVRSTVDFSSVMVLDREFTGAGFLTEFSRKQELKLFPDGFSLRWGKVGARLNASKVETGYLVYIDDGFITSVEGYTYGDAWPTTIDQIELYDIELGMPLLNPPRTK
jgi:hypothetical protein